MMRWHPVVKVALLSVTLSVCLVTDAARVTTQNGVIEGLIDEVLGVTVERFLGVPFAKPPVGDLRFK